MPWFLRRALKSSTDALLVVACPFIWKRDCRIKNYIITDFCGTEVAVPLMNSSRYYQLFLETTRTDNPEYAEMRKQDLWVMSANVLFMGSTSKAHMR